MRIAGARMHLIIFKGLQTRPHQTRPLQQLIDRNAWCGQNRSRGEIADPVRRLDQRNLTDDEIRDVNIALAAN